MTKVLVRYGIHPGECGRYAAAMVQNKYKKDPQVKFERYKYFHTIEHGFLSRVRKNPLLFSGELQKFNLLAKLTDKELHFRRQLNKKAFKQGFLPIEIHTDELQKPKLIYPPMFEKKAQKLAEHLRKKGYHVDCVGLLIVQDRVGPGLFFELPGQKSKVKGPWPATANYRSVQTLDQLRLSKKILKETIDFLKTQDLK